MDNSSLPSASSKDIETNNKEDLQKFVTISEKVSLTKSQYEVLNVICNTYEESVSHYMREALIETMRSDLEEGTFCDALLNKIMNKKENEESRGKEGAISSPFNVLSSAESISQHADLQF